MHFKYFSCEKKDVEGKLDTAEGPRMPQAVSTVANFEVLETGAYIVSTPVTHEITAVSEFSIVILCSLENVPWTPRKTLLTMQ